MPTIPKMVFAECLFAEFGIQRFSMSIQLQAGKPLGIQRSTDLYSKAFHK